ncbi:telomerase RNA component interacting RNase [Gastrophryne carolinensis]
MAEESSRSAAEDDSEAAEEGEEAAVAPLKEAAVPKKEAPKAAIAVDNLPPPEEKAKAAIAVDNLPPPVEKAKAAIAVDNLPPPEEKAKAAIVDTAPEEKQKAAVEEENSPARKPGPPACPSTTAGVNLFANDGSFLELFKKKMDAKPAASKEEPKPEADKRKPISFVGKRRGGAKLALKTGMVAKKPKAEDEGEVMSEKGGAWAQYMAEVKKYKAHQCSDDDKTRPLVK